MAGKRTAASGTETRPAPTSTGRFTTRAILRGQGQTWNRAVESHPVPKKKGPVKGGIAKPFPPTAEKYCEHNLGDGQNLANLCGLPHQSCTRELDTGLGVCGSSLAKQGGQYRGVDNRFLIYTDLRRGGIRI